LSSSFSNPTKNPKLLSILKKIVSLNYEKYLKGKKIEKINKK